MSAKNSSTHVTGLREVSINPNLCESKDPTISSIVKDKEQGLKIYSSNLGTFSQQTPKQSFTGGDDNKSQSNALSYTTGLIRNNQGSENMLHAQNKQPALESNISMSSKMSTIER